LGDPFYEDGPLAVGYFIDDAMIANAYAPTLRRL
jgi:hypothetical protein